MGISFTPPNPEQYIMQGLVKRGLPPHVAQGFVMNFKDESGLNPGINEQNPTVPGSRGGYGLYQLTGPRRRAYEAYAAQQGAPLDSVDAQLDFMVSELKGPENAAFKAIMAAPDAGTAGTAIVQKFLRPAPEHQSSRSAKYMGMADGPKGQESYPAPTFGNMAPPTGMQHPAGIDPAVAQYAFAEDKKPLGDRMQEAGKHFSAAMAAPAPRPSQFPGGPSAEQAGGLLKALKSPNALAMMMLQRRRG